ncbi:protein ALWAYS EARLY 3-like [Tasmannia lanceolata]|uniref:protein ALWAYS EARLY 3-like n=1 Tax=Tasmannia lanceolata TaxID=3420 RepID=UPI0040640944
MPVNPLENMSEALRRKNVSVDKFHENLNDPKLHSLPKDRKIDGSMKFFSSENLENGDGPSHLALSNYPMITAMKQAKGDTVDSVVQAKAALNEIISSQAANGHPCTLAQIQAKEADIRALSEVTRALDRKFTLYIIHVHAHSYIIVQYVELSSYRCDVTSEAHIEALSRLLCPPD